MLTLENLDDSYSEEEKRKIRKDIKQEIEEITENEDDVRKALDSLKLPKDSPKRFEAEEKVRSSLEQYNEEIAKGKTPEEAYSSILEQLKKEKENLNDDLNSKTYRSGSDTPIPNKPTKENSSSDEDSLEEDSPNSDSPDDEDSPNDNPPNEDSPDNDSPNENPPNEDLPNENPSNDEDDSPNDADDEDSPDDGSNDNANYYVDRDDFDYSVDFLQCDYDHYISILEEISSLVIDLIHYLTNYF